MKNVDPRVRRVVIGKVIGALRERAGMSQMAFAHAIGVSQPTLSRFERGTSVPDMVQMAAIERELGLPPGGLNAKVEETLRRTRKAAQGATEGANGTSVWSNALKIAGIAGIAGLAAFAIAAVLTLEDREEEEEP